MSDQVDACVEALAAQVESADDVESILWETWGTVIARACRTPPAEQQHLVDLVMALRDRGDVDTIWDQRLWSDLPLLGPQLREAWSWAAPPATTDDTWIRLNAFVARLTAAGYDSGLLGLWTLRAATEEGSATDADREAARAWLDLAGDVLECWSEQARRFDDVAEVGYSSSRLAAWRSELSRGIHRDLTPRESPSLPTVET